MTTTQQQQPTTTMKAILICPEHRPAGGFFQRMRPLALMPVAGRTLLDLALTELKREGVEEVVVLASDRPEMVRKAAGQGRAWGLRVEVRAVAEEPGLEAAELEHGRRKAGERRPLVRVLDRVPGQVEGALWTGTEATFETLFEAARDAGLAAQVTMREQAPGVWISTKAQVSPWARITGPAWVGPHASVRAGAEIGPGAVVEGGAFIDSQARVEQAWVGPDTYVGKGLILRDAAAWGQGLLGVRSRVFQEVRDGFWLTDLASHQGGRSRASAWERLLALVLLVVTLPRALPLLVRGLLGGGGCLEERRVVSGPLVRVDAFARTQTLRELRGARGLFGRWPELWEVVCGRLALVGNRPLTPEECTALRGALGEQWLKHASGVFSLSDAHGEMPLAGGAKASAHAAYFSAHRGLREQLRILRRCLPDFVLGRTQSHRAAGTFFSTQLPNQQANTALP